MPEILDPSVFPAAPSSRVPEPEILAARRAFAVAQDLLSGSPIGPAVTLAVGWYGSAAHPEVGSFAVVGKGMGQDDLIGEVIRVGFQNRHVFAYVLRALRLPDGQQIAMTRRCFSAVARLSMEPISGRVAVIG